MPKSPAPAAQSRVGLKTLGMEGWEPNKTIKLPDPEKARGGLIHRHTLYLWKIGNDGM